jgi:hypothetical protein
MQLSIPLTEIFEHSLMVTVFVFIMMLVIEYLNVFSNGKFHDTLKKRAAGQSLWTAFLGSIPGCLGSISVVSLYSHRMVSLGGVIGCMIATTGDAGFLMLARIPKEAVMLMLFLWLLGVMVGRCTDYFFAQKFLSNEKDDHGLEIHHSSDVGKLFHWERILNEWKNCTPIRGLLVFCMGISLLGLLTETMQHHVEAPWVQGTLMIVSLLGIFIVSTVPDHFLEEHVWQHLTKRHVPRMFFWVFLSFLLIDGFLHDVDLTSFVDKSPWLFLLIAILMGCIPDAGPQFIFITLYADGSIPLSILLANSIVQDGHGMTPMLAYSKKTFLIVKLVNSSIALLLGAILLMLGF